MQWAGTTKEGCSGKWKRERLWKRRIIPTYGKHEGVKLVGILNYETGEVYVEKHKRYDDEIFRRFLIHVLEHYPEGESVMILDNAKLHHAKLLKDILKANPRLHLEFRSIL